MFSKILIIGAGPAGAAAAIFLAEAGYEITLIERESKWRSAYKIGESLPPNTEKLIKQLGLWETFQAGPHLKYYSNKSIWGSDEVAFTDFIQQPPGYGWHIDRRAFEDMLIGKAEKSGVELLFETILTESKHDGVGWEIKLQNKGQEMLKSGYSFIIDASGRNSWFARRQGIDRLYESRQLALIAFLKSNNSLEDTASLIETTAAGWWYSAKIPDNRIAMSFLCKPDQSKRNLWTKEGAWWALLEQAPHTFQRIKKADAKLLEPPHFVSADSGILESVYGKGWVAVGDAAMTYDPIASHGILMAMVSARDASKAIQQHLSGQEDALGNYQALLWAAFQHYTQQRKQFYEAEKRFGDSAYWNNID